jgi:hypothetical protein
MKGDEELVPISLAFPFGDPLFSQPRKDRQKADLKQKLLPPETNA